MKAIPILLAAAALGLPAAAQSPSATAPGGTPIKPGYWESTNRLLSPFRSTSTERRCITPADVDKFLAGPSNHHYDCTYPGRTIENGRILLSGTCVERKKKQKVRVTGEGSYTPTSFHITASIATRVIGIPISGRASTDARRIGDTCPDDAGRLTLK